MTARLLSKQLSHATSSMLRSLWTLVPQNPPLWVTEQSSRQATRRHRKPKTGTRVESFSSWTFSSCTKVDAVVRLGKSCLCACLAQRACSVHCSHTSAGELFGSHTRAIQTVTLMGLLSSEFLFWMPTSLHTCSSLIASSKQPCFLVLSSDASALSLSQASDWASEVRDTDTPSLGSSTLDSCCSHAPPCETLFGSEV